MCLKRKMTRATAEQISARSHGKTREGWRGKALWCYACKVCGWWHMTSSPPRGR